MSDEPQLPPMPDLGDILDRKKRMVEKITSVIKCKECKAKFDRPFKVGDYTYKALLDEQCEKCNNKNTLVIEEIYSEWIDPRKH